jgi:hypothetical protein
VFTVTLPMLPTLPAQQPDTAAAGTDDVEARDVRDGRTAGEVSDPGARRAASGEGHGAGLRDIGD